MDRSTLLALALVTALVPTAASGCVAESSAVTLVTDAATLYVHFTRCDPDCVEFLWIYEESNGVEGLQRDDAHARSCDAGEAADTRHL